MSLSTLFSPLYKMWGLAWAPIHSFIQQWLVGAYSVPSTVCGTEDTAADKTNKPLLSRNSYPSKGSKNKIKTPVPNKLNVLEEKEVGIQGESLFLNRSPEIWAPSLVFLH